MVQPNKVPTEIFLVGSGRSGTTIGLHAISCVESVGTIPRIAGRVPRMMVPASLMARCGLGPSGWITPSAEATGLFAEAGITRDFPFLELHQKGNLSTTVDLRPLRKRISQARRYQGVRTIALKNTMAGLLVPMLSEGFPSSVFIHMVRHPAEVVRSLLNVDFWPSMPLWWDPHRRSPAAYAVAEGLLPEDVAAIHWRVQVNAAALGLATVGGDRVLTMRYSDLVTDPLLHVRSLRQVGLTVAESELAARLGRLDIRPVSSAPPNKRIIAAVQRQCADAIDAFGLERS